MKGITVRIGVFMLLVNSVVADTIPTPTSTPTLITNTLAVDANTTYQTIKGFGANINTKHWDNGALKTNCLDLMIDDMGCTMFRTDAWGQSDWLDPENTRGASCLNQTRYNEVYAWPEFAAVRDFGLYLNSKGLQPYINISGYVSEWMNSPGTKNLDKKQYDNYAEMCRSYIKWLRDSGVSFKYFNGSNENDMPPREGPGIAAADLPLLYETIVSRFATNGLGDIKLIVPEAGTWGHGLDQLVADTNLVGKIGFSGHSYVEGMPGWFYKRVKISAHGNTEVWMGEFGTLDQGATDDIAKVIYVADILFRSLLNNVEAAMTWDAFDNYHWHDKEWTRYGVFNVSPPKNSPGMYVGGSYKPKLRYYGLKQVYKYVKPGFVRCDAIGGPIPVVTAFRSSDKTKVTIVGYNDSGSSKTVDIKLNSFKPALAGTNLTVYRTSAFENCKNVGIVTLSSNLDCSVTVPDKCIFTITNQN
jgi:O-glycosyl hydrolase